MSDPSKSALAQRIPISEPLANAIIRYLNDPPSYYDKVVDLEKKDWDTSHDDGGLRDAITQETTLTRLDALRMHFEKLNDTQMATELKRVADVARTARRRIDHADNPSLSISEYTTLIGASAIVAEVPNRVTDIDVVTNARLVLGSLYEVQRAAQQAPARHSPARIG